MHHFRSEFQAGFDFDLRHQIPITGLELSVELWTVISGGARFDDQSASVLSVAVANKKTLLSAIWEKGLIVQAYLGGFQQPSNAGRVFKPV